VITSVEPLRISYCRELIMRLMVKVKKVWDLSVFFLTNVVLNGGDIISDGLTAYALCKQYFLGAKILKHCDTLGGGFQLFFFNNAFF
jgi:hypothetical protein